MFAKIKASLQRKTILLGLILSGIFFAISLIFIQVGDAEVLPFFQTWMLVASRGTFGRSGALEQIEKNKGYTRELLGDIAYIHGNTGAARTAFEEAIMYNPHERIIKKLSLLSESRSGSSNVESGSTIDRGVIESSLNRIQNDAANREKYFGKSESYSNTLPIFDERTEETIDW